MPAQTLHSRLEPLLLFFVDGASAIDPEEDAWDLLLAVKHVNGQPRVVGGQRLSMAVHRLYALPELSTTAC